MPSPENMRQKIEARGHHYWDGSKPWPKGQHARRGVFTSSVPTYYPMAHYVRYGTREQANMPISVTFIDYDVDTGNAKPARTETLFMYRNYSRLAGTYHRVMLSADAVLDEMQYDKDGGTMPAFAPRFFRGLQERLMNLFRGGGS